MSIEKPGDLLYRVSKFGVSICIADKSLAEKMIVLLDKYNVYYNRGAISMPEDIKMRIDLVDGWQNQKRTMRLYPLGIQDRAVLDKKHDKLYVEGKIDWIKRPAPIACPVFIVWQNGNIVKNSKVIGIKKGRVVINLRPVNRLVIPDSYPLPN